MEPLLDKEKRANGLAPVVRWSDPSPSPSPSPRMSPKDTFKETPQDTSPARVTSSDLPSPQDSPSLKSAGSSGIGPDSPETPLSSSLQDEPNLFASTPSAISEDNKDDAPTVITENPGYEVKFNIKPEVADSIVSSESYEDEDNFEDKPKIPDGGWGWVVVLASLVISMIADGISFSFGLLFLEFLKEFRASKSATSWIGSLFMAVPLMAGPICSALVDRYGCRWMTILGGVISGVGFILSTFCDSIYLMYLTFGVIAGIGLGLCYVTAVVSIAYWFDKKRTLATSLGACGTGIGTFVYAPMTQYFITEYGWRGTVLLLAGTFFNFCVCGAVMRDPEWWTKEQNKPNTLLKQSKNTSSCGSISGKSTSGSEFPGVEEIRKLMKSGESPEYLLTALVTSMKKSNPTSSDQTEGNISHNFHSVVNLPTFIRQNEKVPLEVLESLKDNQRLYNLIVENYPSLLLSRSISDHGRLNKAADAIGLRVPVPVTMSVKVKPQVRGHQGKAGSPPADAAAQPLIQESRVSPTKTRQHSHSHNHNGPVRVDSVPWLRRQFSMKENTNHYLKNIRLHRDSVMYRGAMLNIHKYRMRATSCPNIYRNSMTTIAMESNQGWQEELKDLLKDMMDFSMFLELHFLLMSLATILLFTWFIVPYFYITDYMKVYNMTEDQGSRILSVIGITNTIGMIGLGWAGDQPWMNVTKVYAVCLVACGLCIIGMPLLMFNYHLLMLTCALFGIFFASNFSFTPTILVELIPLERFTTAYGLVLLCQGIGNLLGPPLAGWMFDLTERWDLSFYMAGVWIMVSGVMVAFIPFTKNRLIWGEGTLEKDKDSIA